MVGVVDKIKIQKEKLLQMLQQCRLYFYLRVKTLKRYDMLKHNI